MRDTLLMYAGRVIPAFYHDSCGGFTSTPEAVWGIKAMPFLKTIRDGRAPKGDVVAVARVAAIQACKRTSELIPLCHPIALTHVAVEIDVATRGTIEVRVACECFGKTGVEMEALTGASVGALAIYDMIKGLDRAASIATTELLAKSGGRSGSYKR